MYKTTFITHIGHYEFKVCPLGLPKFPLPFRPQRILSIVPHEVCFCVFDDILIYSKSLSAHVEHLLLVSNTLLFHFLYAKRSKCSFGQSKEYLGHVLKDMEEWPTPRTVKALRGFLGVTGYYRKYVPNYERIIRLLSDLLKKNVIVRIEEADQSVAAIKKVMSATPMLALPNS